MAAITTVLPSLPPFYVLLSSVLFPFWGRQAHFLWWQDGCQQVQVYTPSSQLLCKKTTKSSNQSTVSRILKGLRFLPYLQATSLACHRFMDAGRKHKTAGTEMKDSLLLKAIAVARVSVFLYWFPRTSPHRAIQRGPDDTCAHRGLHYRRGALSCLTLNCLWWSVENYYLYYTRQ